MTFSVHRTYALLFWLSGGGGPTLVGTLLRTGLLSSAGVLDIASRPSKIKEFFLITRVFDVVTLSVQLWSQHLTTTANHPLCNCVTVGGEVETSACCLLLAQKEYISSCSVCTQAHRIWSHSHRTLHPSVTTLLYMYMTFVCIACV